MDDRQWRDSFWEKHQQMNVLSSRGVIKPRRGAETFWSFSVSSIFINIAALFLKRQ